MLITTTVNGQLSNSFLLSGGSNGIGFSLQRQVSAKFAVGVSGNNIHASTKLFHYFAGKIIKTKASTNSLQAEAFVKWLDDQWVRMDQAVAAHVAQNNSTKEEVRHG